MEKDKNNKEEDIDKLKKIHLSIGKGFIFFPWASAPK